MRIQKEKDSFIRYKEVVNIFGTVFISLSFLYLMNHIVLDEKSEDVCKFVAIHAETRKKLHVGYDLLLVNNSFSMGRINCVYVFTRSKHERVFGFTAPFKEVFLCPECEWLLLDDMEN